MENRFGKFLAIAWAAIVLSNVSMADESGTLRLSSNESFSFGQGPSQQGGEADILWNGVSLEPRGSAALFNLGNYGERAFGLITARHTTRVSYSSTPIPARTLVAGDIFGVRTNTGDYAKVIVISSAKGVLSLKYTTFGRQKTAAAPANASSTPIISSVLNNYSYILPGLPNYGIAPGSIFVIFGNGLSSADPPVLQSSAAPGLPTTLNQTSLSVTVNGVKTTPAIYYTSATSIAAVLPSNTPAGLGSLIVTYNGASSLSFAIQVVPNAPGLDTLYGAGNGAGVATDSNGNVIGLTNAAKPGQTIILWGSGIGGDTNNDDRTYPQKQLNQTASVNAKVFIGGVASNVLYTGRSQYPGLDQYNVVVPPNLNTGCFVSVAMTVGPDASPLASNAVTIPVSANGASCTDPATGLSGTALQNLGSKTAANTLALALGYLEDGDKLQPSILALPVAFPPSVLAQGYEYASQGSCTVIPPRQGNFNPAVLDIGSVQITGPAGTINVNGLQTAFPGNSIPSGSYTFTGSGGADIGPFKTTINYEPAVTVTNQDALSTITRSQGVTVNWTGGPASGNVMLLGWVGNRYGSTRFVCHAPASAGKMTVPASILLSLNTGPGGIEVFTMNSALITAKGLDIGYVLTGGEVLTKSTYK
jgi:uncharacterized protein (TIGR03437 family)